MTVMIDNSKKLEIAAVLYAQCDFEGVVALGWDFCHGSEFGEMYAHAVEITSLTDADHAARKAEVAEENERARNFRKAQKNLIVDRGAEHDQKWGDWTA